MKYLSLPALSAACALACGAALLVTPAQAADTAAATAASKTPKAAPAKRGATAPAAKSTPAAAAKKKASTRKLAPSAVKAVEEVTAVDDDPSIQLNEAQLELARRVHTGQFPCELGAAVRVHAARREGLFVVTTAGYRFLMHPVESRTGALRLEDGKRGALWLQLGNKSMLMSQKLGRRLADECQSATQAAYAETLKKNPLPNLLDPAPARAASAPAAQRSEADGPDASAAPLAPVPAADESSPAASAAAAATPTKATKAARPQAAADKRKPAKTATTQATPASPAPDTPAAGADR